MNMQDADIEKTVVGTIDDNRTQVVSQPSAEATQFAANVECPVCKTNNPPSETYCMDCGFLLASAPVAVEDMPAPQPTGVLVSEDGTREFPLNQGENSVGRENVDILLSGNVVSRRHAKVIVENGKAFVEDLGSTNGTKVDGNRINQGDRVELADGAEVSFGDIILKYKAPAVVETEEEADTSSEVTVMAAAESQQEAPVDETEDKAETVEEEAAEETEDSDTAAEPEVQAPVVVGKLISTDGSFSFDLSDGKYTVGRRQGANDIVIPDPYASGRHADLAVEDGKYILTDIGSTNGTLVNGTKLDANVPREITEGDEITIGRMVFKIEVAE